MADCETEDALAHSFLAELPAEVISELRAGGERADYPAGTTVYQPGSEPRAALVVRGLLRVFLASLEGRQVTVRYARPGDVLGIAVLVGGPASVGVQAVEPSGLFRLSSRTLLAAARRDARVSWAIAGELNRRLYDTLEQTAVNAFGSVRQRVAAHLLDLASAQQEPALAGRPRLAAGAGRRGRVGPRGGGPGAARAAGRRSHRDRGGPHRDPGCDPVVRRVRGIRRPVTLVARAATQITDMPARWREPG